MEKEKLNNYSWTTEFKTAENLMIHTRSDRVKAVTNIHTGTIKVFRDDTLITENTIPAIAEYEKFLLGVAKDANTLKNFTNPKE